MQAVHACEIAECAETHARAPPRSATCSFTSPPEVLRLDRRLPFCSLLGHPNSLKIAVVPYKTYKERVNDHLPLSVRHFGGPSVPKGAKIEPKWKQMGSQNELKTEVSKKSAECGLDPLYIYYIFSLLAPSENLTFSHL